MQTALQYICICNVTNCTAGILTGKGKGKGKVVPVLK